MLSYFMPIKVAFILFSVLGFLLIIPWLIYSYRKYGFFSLWTSLIAYSFAFYMLSALFLVLLPLPSTRNTCALQSPDMAYYSLIPFYFVWDAINSSSIVWSQPATYFQIFKESAFLQAAFNFLLLLPLGVYLRYYFQRRRYWKRAFALGFALSLFYELTQVTGIYGLYTCPYRIFDVDDLILNSTGALFGYLIAPIVLALFPSRKSVLAKKEKMLEKRMVPPFSHLLALLIDVFLINVIWSLTIGFLTLSRSAEMIYTTIGYFVIFFFVPLLWEGKTIGTNFMRFKLIGTDDSTPRWQSLLKRFFAIYFPWLISMSINGITDIKLDMNSPLYPFHVWGSLAAISFGIIMWAVLFIHAVMVILSKGNRLFYFDYVAKLIPSKK
jgi:glycopeptide antibiotics resistance protein